MKARGYEAGYQNLYTLQKIMRINTDGKICTTYKAVDRLLFSMLLRKANDKINVFNEIFSNSIKTFYVPIRFIPEDSTQ